MNFDSFFNFVEENNLSPSFFELRENIENIKRHGDYNKFVSILQGFPKARPSKVFLNEDSIKIGEGKDLTEAQRAGLISSLKALIPWRKGPFEIFEIKIDSEWRSDFKWNRLSNEISPLQGRLILDVGSGNGYHCWRMKGAGAKAVVGIDPYLLSVVQFQSIKQYLNAQPVWVLPVGVQEMPENIELFDTVFSMGVLYHRRSPFEHLFQLKSFLRNGGELVLETLVIDGKQNEVLVPEGRYAKMRNVWFIPSALTLESWLKRAGFKNIRLINVTKTTPAEQRRTDWMPWESLSDFLNHGNENKTIEGYPAPVRALFICNKE